jgi:serine protease AprX
MRRDLMRHDRGSSGDLRWSALWGKPSKGEARSSALWGKGGRGFLATLVVAVGLAAPVAYADSGSGSPSFKAYTTPGLLGAAEANPNATFQVIVEGDRTTGWVAKQIADFNSSKAKVKRRYSVINGVAATLTGKQVLILARKSWIRAITEDAPVRLASFSTSQQWPYASGVVKSWWDNATNVVAQTPTIAVVDSGIEASRPDFAGRVLAQVNLTSIQPNSPGDGRGHGTFVAGIAAGGGDWYAGADPRAKLVSIDVMDDNGMAMTRDVIAAADWILQNRAAYNIRVANFSLHSASPNSFMFDPLDKAVERLWFSGVTVVVAAGNYGIEGQPSGVPFAPGNDPFVITVGALDIEGSVKASDDSNAPWSAYGYTLDGFSKPELAAPGRYMVGPVPAASTLPLERPTNVVAPGYMQLSGTSFAAPVVSGAAAYLLALHPDWTPDQVKGALMLSAKALPNAAPLSAGVGEVNVAAAVTVADPPNPNRALNNFLVSDPAGGSGRVFDAASWANVAQASASWANASWANASWASASWSSASWASASWSNASWASASWAATANASASWADASWSNASWASASWADNAGGDASATGGYWLNPTELEAAAADLELGPAADSATVLP